jgi:hypothetical protein
MLIAAKRSSMREFADPIPEPASRMQSKKY